MDSRERVQTVLSGGVPDRVPFQDSYWQATVRRWRREGLAADVDLGRHFGFDIAQVGSVDDTLQLPARILEETGRQRVQIDTNGATRREMQEADGWVPSWLDFSIKSRDDWARLRDRAAYNPTRIGKGAVRAYEAARREGKFCVYSIHACFHPTWHKVGMERMLLWMHEDPQLVADMFAAHTQLVIDGYEAMKAMGVEYDGVFLPDDLAYRNGPFISPAMYRDLIMPYHRQACEHFARDGLTTILHSDGDVRPLIPSFLEAGFGALHPLEAKAGLDVRELKPQYGDQLTLYGNIDVRRLAGSREEIEEEIRTKLAVAKEGGGYMYHSDHSVSSDVSLDNYLFAVDLIRQHGRYD